jgi:hypothetical protein
LNARVGELTVIDQRIEKLKVENDKLRRLLGDPHPGLSTWMLMVPKLVQELQDILDGKRDD